MFSLDATGLTKQTNDLAELQAGLKKIAGTKRYGATSLNDCLVAAAEAMPQEVGERKVILVMSDFEDNTSRNSLEKTVLRMHEMGTTVYPLVDREPPTYSERAKRIALKAADAIAKETGGIGYVFNKPQELEKALEQVHNVLRNSYVLKFRTTVTAKKGKSVAVKIAVQRDGVKVVAASERFPAVR